MNLLNQGICLELNINQNNFFMDKEVKKLLNNVFKENCWIVARNTEGLSKETYIAHNNQKKVFIKFDVNILPLKRIVQLRLAPKIIYQGISNTRTFIIQEFLEGIHPTREWYSKNMSKLANVIQTYHNDKELFNILSDGVDLDYKKHVESGVRFLNKELGKVKGIFKKYKIQNEIESLVEQSKQLQLVNLVPIHSDPNYRNCILVKDKLFMIDWDDVRLSDPFRDIAPMLWWYFKKEYWSRFLDYFSLTTNKETMDRFYWWTARQSLTIAIFHAKKRNLIEVGKYLQDFKAALKQKENPHFKN